MGICRFMRDAVGGVDMPEQKQRGGRREGAGRKASLPDGARFRGINLTDEEFIAVKKLIANMREEKTK